MAFRPLDQENIYLSTTALGKWKIVYENRFFNDGRCITEDYMKTVLDTMAPIRDINLRRVYGNVNFRRKLRASIPKILRAPYIPKDDKGTQPRKERDRLKGRLSKLPQITTPGVPSCVSLMTRDGRKLPSLPSADTSALPTIPSDGCPDNICPDDVGAIESVSPLPEKPVLYRRPRATRPRPLGVKSHTDFLSAWRRYSFTHFQDDPLSPESFYASHYPLVLTKVARRFSGKRPLWPYAARSIDMSFFDGYSIFDSDNDDSDDANDTGGDDKDETGESPL